MLCAAGYNLRWLLRMIAKKGAAFLWAPYLRLRKAAAMTSNLLRVLRELLNNASTASAPQLMAA